ncbi:hypothetical protein RN001_013974 [Aquatica leii]|uniref:Lysophospholipid acyltransferase 7 n=1 Tax=Aquatica leii TaxID=1421715 RepID=A0AAN7P0U6_9COLE|nr:hypothetical protein RN001_013974 [Aquatica leii]
MDLDDIVYIVLLFVCFGFGYIYRQIQNIEQKKWIGSGLGLLIILLVSGYHICHPLFTFLINAFIILLLPKRSSHVISFAFTFLYLIFFRTTIYFGIPYPPAHTNMIQMILTLKLVGLAFEVNSSYLITRRIEEATSLEKSLEDESNIIDPSFIDIFHYTFNYIGLLTGPYYRYRTQRDFFNLPFSSYAKHTEESVKKLFYIPLYAFLFLWATYNWPLSYALSDEFYNDRSWLYRFWYCWPNFFIFRMRLYTAMLLSECICTMAGMGAYPSKCQSRPGQGPSTNFEEMKTIVQNPERLKTEKYNFQTIHNIDPYGSDFCTTFREGIKHWNICVQYWFAVNIYKRFPNKKFRTVTTMLLSAFWHGMYTGHYVCIGLAPFYLIIEDVYVKLFLKDNLGPSLHIWEWIIWFFKMLAFSYLSMAFTLLSLDHVIRYYSSVYYIGFIGFAVMYAVGIRMLKQTKIRNKNTEQAKKDF